MPRFGLYGLGQACFEAAEGFGDVGRFFLAMIFWSLGRDRRGFVRIGLRRWGFRRNLRLFFPWLCFPFVFL